MQVCGKAFPQSLVFLLSCALLLGATARSSDGSDTAPTITKIPKQLTNVNTPTPEISFTVSDPDTPVENLTVLGTSSNPLLVPNENVLIGGSGPNRSVSVTPAPDQVGKATITLTVSDGSQSSSRNFSLKVKASAADPSNIEPAISPIADQSIEANTAAGPIVFTIEDVESAAKKLAVWATCSDPILVPNENIVVDGKAGDRTLTITPAANQAGVAMICVRVSDGFATNQTSFKLSVNPVSFPISPLVYFAIEAESGILAGPMNLIQDAQASGGAYVMSPVEAQGSVTFTVNIPITDVYAVWCKVLARDASSNSFSVSVDGGAADMFDVAENRWSGNWQWTALNGRAGGEPLTLNPRLLLLSEGTHTLVFEAAEPNTLLDRLILTNDGEVAFR